MNSWRLIIGSGKECLGNIPFIVGQATFNVKCSCNILYCLGVRKMMQLYMSMLSLNDMKLKVDNIIPLGASSYI